MKLLENVINSRGYDIIGHHHLYLSDSDEYPKNIEFLGFAGKTHTLRAYAKKYNLKKIKPLSKTNLDSIITPADLEIVNRINSIYAKNNGYRYFKKLESLLRKIKIKNKHIKLGSIYWDEGIVKENLHEFIILEKNTDLFEKYLKDFMFIILLPSFNVAVDRYTKRDNITDNSVLIKNLELNYSYLSQFILLLKKYNHKYIILDNSIDASIVKINEFLRGSGLDKKI